ncbi:hypothetical protein VFPBJ_11648 [Purpureocillium lilacinum]|uniref:Uncharacterized protein n=1 Tax=Purpureocillium lilacinum TaxID=33203 RepID=A0A179F0V5_PURLI|nr:hypothetical protein VFPBJ_11648 [Purpureocillium lilacinum]
MKDFGEFDLISKASHDHASGPWVMPRTVGTKPWAEPSMGPAIGHANDDKTMRRRDEVVACGPICDHRHTILTAYPSVSTFLFSAIPLPTWLG